MGFERNLSEGAWERALFLEQGLLAAEGTIASVVGEYLRSLDVKRPGLATDLVSVSRSHGLSVVLVEGYINGVPLGGNHTFLPESRLTFELKLVIPKTMAQSTMGIHFENELGIRLYAVNSRWEIRKIDLRRGTYIMRCTIPAVPLVPGTYYISIRFSALGKQVDWLERVSSIEIVRTDVYGTGELPWADQGYFLAHAKWSSVRLPDSREAR